MNKDDALKIIAMLAAGYPNWKPTDETVELYVMMIEPMPAEPAKQAVMEILRSGERFAPPVGVLIQTATRIAVAVAGHAAMSGEEAWGTVAEAIHYLGYYRGPGDFGGNRAIKHAVDAVGWENLCTDENVIATRAQFIRIFDAYQARELGDAARQISQGVELGRIEGRK